MHEKIEITKQELTNLVRKKSFLEKDLENSSYVEEKYETIKLEIQEISLRNKESLDSEISFKQREVERMEISLKQLNAEEKELIQEFEELKGILSKKENVL